jgi:hypothetical protein
VIVFFATFKRWVELLQKSKAEPTPPKTLAAAAGD